MDQIKSLKLLMEKNNLCSVVLHNLIIDHTYMFEISHIERSQLNTIFGTSIKEQLPISEDLKSHEGVRVTRTVGDA